MQTTHPQVLRAQHAAIEAAFTKPVRKPDHAEVIRVVDGKRYSFCRNCGLTSWQIGEACKSQGAWTGMECSGEWPAGPAEVVAFWQQVANRR